MTYRLGRRGLDLPQLTLRPIHCRPIAHALPEWEGMVGSVSWCKPCGAAAILAASACVQCVRGKGLKSLVSINFTTRWACTLGFSEAVHCL